MGEKLTVKALHDETGLERWDKKGVPVEAEFGGRLFVAIGFTDEAERFVLQLEAVNPFEPECSEGGE